MRTVNIAELKNNLSRYLEEVRGGDEVLVRDRNRPIAKIVPLRGGDYEDEEMALAAAGIIRLPDAPLPKGFWRLPAPKVELSDIRAAIKAERDESWDRILGRQRDRPTLVLSTGEPVTAAIPSPAARPFGGGVTRRLTAHWPDSAAKGSSTPVDRRRRARDWRC